MSKLTIGVIGAAGVVGQAVTENFKDTFNIAVYDPKIKGSAFVDVLDSQALFLCLPSQTLVDGSQDLISLTNTLLRLKEVGYRQPVVIKTTVLPGTCQKFKQMFPGLIIVHNPEFLKQTTAVKDFADQTIVLLSGGATQAVESIYRMWKPEVKVMRSVHFEDTEFAKYIHNSFLAMKVIYMNEMTAYQEKLGLIDVMRAKEMAASQDGIGKSHLMVPGPDGKRGYSGACFPKDVKAILTGAHNSGVELNLIALTSLLNDKLRK